MMNARAETLFSARTITVQHYVDYGGLRLAHARMHMRLGNTSASTAIQLLEFAYRSLM